METVLIILGVWLLASLAVALLVGRFLRVGGRRERATTITAAGASRSTRETGGGEVHETA
jgi:hypothetical protein